jgi:hypothetical protein
VPPVPGSIYPAVFYRATKWTQNGVPASFVPINFVSLSYLEAEQHVGVTTGCGSIDGTAVFDGTHLQLSNVSRNRTMEDDSFCTDADKHQDDVMAAFFTSAPTYTMTNTNLDFASSGMTLSFVVSPD